MTSNLLHNHLRAARIELGLSQRQLAVVLGLRSAARICALETGRVAPTLEDCIAFNILFKRTGEQLWPRLHVELEAAADLNIRRLIQRLSQGRQRTIRERAQGKRLARKLAILLDGLPEDIEHIA